MIFFYTLTTIILLSCTLLVSARNPLYSLLSLVLIFICGSLHLLFLGVDFLAFVFIIVYVGALAVLFLFVVIILDIKLSKIKNFKSELPIVFLIANLSFIYLDYTNYDSASSIQSMQIQPRFIHLYDEVSCMKALGIALYTKYVIHFVLVGLVLLVAIIGAIVLTSIGRYQKENNKEKHLKQGQRHANIGKFRSN